MKARIFLFLFLLLLPMGLKAQGQAKITEALDDFQPEIILEDAELPEVPAPNVPTGVPSAKKSEHLGKAADEDEKNEELILEEPAEITEQADAGTGNKAKASAKTESRKKSSVLVRRKQNRTSGTNEVPNGAGADENVNAGKDADSGNEVAPNDGVLPKNSVQSGENAAVLIPFNPGSRMMVRPGVSADGTDGSVSDGKKGKAENARELQFITDPAEALEAFFAKYQFPYSFIRVNVLKENIVSRPVEGVMQMEVPLIISFDSELYAEFQQELAELLSGIAVSAPQELDLTKIRHSLRPARKNVILNLQTSGERYIAFELSPECREILARHAALVPTASLTLYDEGKNLLDRHYFPLLYRDVVKAYPINLLGVYHGDSQTIRIYPHQEEKFAEFVHEQAASFVIPEPFPVIAAYSASEAFLNRTAKNFYLESNFRRGERFPEISYMVYVQVSAEDFQKIRFMNCTVMTEQAGVPVTEGGKKNTPEFSEETLRILDENLTETDGENSILEPAEKDSEAEAAHSEILSEAADTADNADAPQAADMSEPAAGAGIAGTSGILLSQSEIASAGVLETSIKRIMKAQNSAVLSFFGEKERNVTLKKQEIEDLAEVFGIELIRKTQTFTSAPSLIPSIGWMEISPGVSLLLLDPGTPESAPASEFTQEAAFWISLENGTLALVSCVLDAEFIRLLNGKFRE
ncbi:MAG: hypothetical protein J6A23_10895 [Thermoguttaceae bacterium]|nr:hypothetical protein [Thermoguttaceae bacterium]MBP3694398.1 hypothetical protein [Thermoguttaceae bacterium]